MITVYYFKQHPMIVQKNFFQQKKKHSDKN